MGGGSKPTMVHKESGNKREKEAGVGKVDCCRAAACRAHIQTQPKCHSDPVSRGPHRDDGYLNQSTGVSHHRHLPAQQSEKEQSVVQHLVL